MSRPLCLLIVLLACIAAQPSLSRASVPDDRAGTIVVALDADGEPVVEYVVAGEAARIRFHDDDRRTYDKVRSVFWNEQRRCGSIDAAGITVSAPGCHPRFRLAWDGQPRDRMYPALIRLQNGGVMIFTGYLMASVGGIPLSWELRPSAGTVAAFRGIRSDRAIELPADLLQVDERGWIYLGPDRFTAQPSATLLIDDGVPAVLRDVIAAVADDVLQLFARELATTPIERPTFFLEWNGRDRPGRNLQADVVPGNVIRFGLNGRGWSQSQPDDVERLQSVVAHEAAHFWNHGKFHPRDDGGPWLHEGNADLLATAALLQLGLLDPSGATRRINASLNSCLIAAGSAASWADLDGRDRGQTPYACGMSLQFAVAALANRHAADVDVFDFWRSLWAEHGEYSESSMLAFVRHSVGDRAADRLGDVLTDAAMPLRTGLIQLLEDAAARAAVGGALSSAESTRLGATLVGWLMRHDCAGGASFFTLDDHFLVDEIEACRVLRGGMRVTRVAGHAVMTEPQAALSAVRSACAAGAAIAIDGIDGPIADIACSAEAIADLPEAYVGVHLSPSDVARVLGGNLSARARTEPDRRIDTLTP